MENIIKDEINPTYYTDKSSIECHNVLKIMFSPEYVKAHDMCSAFTYLWRHKFKGGNTDIKKAKWYIDRLLEYPDLTDHDRMQIDELIRQIKLIDLSKDKQDQATV